STRVVGRTYGTGGRLGQTTADASSRGIVIGRAAPGGAQAVRPRRRTTTKARPITKGERPATGFGYARVRQAISIRIVLAAMITGGYGRSKPHQKTAPIGTSTRATIAPARRPFHSSPAATSSRTQTARNP